MLVSLIDKGHWKHRLYLFVEGRVYFTLYFQISYFYFY